MRTVVVVALLATAALAEPPRWQQASNPPALSRVWGINGTVYGAGSTGVYRSTDGGATWSMVNAGAAAGVWGAAKDDLWIVRAKTIHQSATGTHWTTQELPMLSYAAQLEGMWGVDRERYLFGADRTGVILRSRDAGQTWRAETLPVEVSRIAGVWGGAANDVYAVGARGVILHSEGDGQWRVRRAPSNGSLEGIWGTNASNIYTVGTGGAILNSSDRGKTWTPRTSGVTYALSSITGVGNELYASSVDGAPLRSNDGKTWKPITAIVRRGHVWSGAERVVIAGGSDVHFFGADTQIATVQLLPLPMPDDRSATLKAYADSFGTSYPWARDLLIVAADQFRGPGPTSLRAALAQPDVKIARISGCSATLDARSKSIQPRGMGTDLIVDLECVESCKATSKPNIKQHAKIYRDGILQRSAEVHFNASDGWCVGTDTELRWNHYSVMSTFVKDLDRELAAALATANSDEARIDARARYVLEGGPHAFVEIELARLLGRPSWWRGFFWNNSIATKPPPPISPQAICKNVVEVSDIEMRADSNQASGNYSAALAGYESILSCKSTLPKKAYLSACRARNHNRARELYVILNQPSLAQICMKEGFDPRTQSTP